MKKTLLIIGSGLLGACATAPQTEGIHDSGAKTQEIKIESVSATTDAAVTQEELAQSTKVDLGASEKAEIPKEVNELVLKWVDYFTGKGRPHMERYMARSTRYTPLMKEILRKNGLPEDLIYLALIESGFSSGARSHAAAVGFWQFMRGTGKTYGLRSTNLIDERRDFERSTEAASSYLKGLYNLFGSWYLAIASYNVGENRVKRVVMENKTRDFWELAKNKELPRETIDYVPKFIAARMIAQHPEKFGFKDIDYAPKIEFEKIQIERPVSLRLLAQNIGVDTGDLKELNPMYRTEYVPVDKGAITLRVPVGKTEVAMGVLEKSFVTSKHAVAKYEYEEGIRKYRVRPGDTLGAIARKFRVSLAALRDANDLGRRAMLRVGMNLNIPSNRRSLASRVKAELRPPKASRIAALKKGNHMDLKKTFYVVRRGDTLMNIARKHNTSVPLLIAKNNLRARNRILPGHRLVIPQ